MKTASFFHKSVLGITLVLLGATVQMGCSQSGYGPPNYGSSPYDQPYYGQSYDQPINPNPDFQQNLSPYGQWVQTPEYGMVWVPNVEPGFQPYATNGHWVVTEYGNTWVSDYAWGWAPFHYGRWYLDRYNRWAWVPGYEWGPAWVSWRSGGGYYGWAPLGPGLNVNVNVNIPPAWWTFVPEIYITSPRLYSYYVPRPRVVNIYHNTTIINNVYRVNNRSYAYGPRREDIERATRRSVPVYRVENGGRPGRTVIRDNAVTVYRPDMNRDGRTNGTYAPNTDRRTYSRGNNNPNAGTYNGDFQNRSTNENRPTWEQRDRSTAPSSRFEQERSTAPSVPQSRYEQERSTAPSSRFEQERNARMNEENRSRFEQRQQMQPSAPQADQSMTRPERRGGLSDAPRFERRQEAPAPQTNSQPQQRMERFENRSNSQPSAPQGNAPTERRSRGPR